MIIKSDKYKDVFKAKYYTFYLFKYDLPCKYSSKHGFFKLAL